MNDTSTDTSTDTYWHMGTVWVADHYEDADTFGGVALIIFVVLMFCLVFYAINCVADTTVGAYNGVRKVVYVVTLPITAPTKWAYRRLSSDI